MCYCLQEPEVEICASMLDALNECIQVCKTYVMKYCWTWDRWTWLFLYLADCDMTNLDNVVRRMVQLFGFSLLPWKLSIKISIIKARFWGWFSWNRKSCVWKNGFYVVPSCAYNVWLYYFWAFALLIFS